MVWISFSVISISVTCLGINLRRGEFLPILPADTSTVSFCWSVLFVYLNLRQEFFHLTLKGFIFIRFMSTIHLSLLDSWGTMRCLALFFKVNRALRCALCSWGSQFFVYNLVRMLWYSLDFIEVPLEFQLIQLTR